MASPTPEQTGRLQSTFQGTDLSSHGLKWDSLWKESYTPWDRGGPSLALADVIRDHPELFPAPAATDGVTRRRTALVPGCGRGWDVLLLSALGYDVVGLDYSEKAVREAAANEERIASGEGKEEKEVYDGLAAGREWGTVTWVQGDFFDDAWTDEVGRREFDVIFDYTFFCALPPEARPRWAKRMSELLTPGTGRLICLEWPLAKDPSTGGPPWGLSAETYLAHLAHPGDDVRYGDDGRPLAEDVQRPATQDGLKCLARSQPRRTHKSGHDGDGKVTDFVSVWGH